MENFILIFLRMSCHVKCFETANKTTPKMNNFILEFYNTNFCFFIGCLYDEMKLINVNACYMRSYFF
jgi:hypothetical protein